MFEALLIGGLTSWGVIDGSPKLLEWMIRFENGTKQQEQVEINKSLEIYFDDHVIGAGQKRMPEVIVETMPQRQQLIIQGKNHD